MKKPRIGPSRLALFDACAKAYKYRYEDGIESESEGVNLALGTITHSVWEEFFHAFHYGKRFDPRDVFERLWSEYMLGHDVLWGKQKEKEVKPLLLKLAINIPTFWDSLGYYVLEDDDGLLVERDFEIEFDDFILSLRPDVVVADAFGRVLPLDVKAQAGESKRPFTMKAVQLRVYQFLVNELSRRGLLKGVTRAGGAAFLQGLKKSGHWLQSDVQHPLSREDEAALYQKMRWMALDVRARRFPERSGNSFSSPCNYCDLAGLCIDGSWEGLRRRTRPAALVPALASVA